MTINNIVMYYHDEATHPDEVHEEYAVQLPCLRRSSTSRKTTRSRFTFLGESANQNVAIVGERNDEYRTVPSVMKLMEKPTDEEVDEMILEADVDDTQCSEQIVDVPVPRIEDRIVEVVTWHSAGANPRASHCTDRQHVRTHTHTQSDGEDRRRFSISRSKWLANAQDAKILSRHRSSSKLVNKL